MFTKLLLTFFTAFVFNINAWSQAASHCVDLKYDKQILTCLNQFAQEQLDENSAAEKSFQRQWASQLRIFNLDPAIMPKSYLQSSFHIRLGQIQDLAPVDGSSTCFNFSKNDDKRYQQILSLEYQILAVAEFLAYYHARSFGRQMSYLFPLKEVVICSKEANDNRIMVFKQRRLAIGLDIDEKEYYSAASLVEGWNSGHPIRNKKEVTLIPDKLRTLYYGIKKEKGVLLRDAIAEKWNVLNPVGDVRVMVMGAYLENFSEASQLKNNWKALKENTSEHLSDEAFGQMWSLVHSHGFSNEHQSILSDLKDNPERIIELFKQWLMNMNDVNSIAATLERGLLNQNEVGSEIVIMARKQTSMVASYANNHEIAVRLNALLASRTYMDRVSEKAHPIEREKITIEEGFFGRRRIEVDVVRGSKVHLNVDRTTGVIFAGNTSDVVKVDVEMPNIEFFTFKKAALLEAIEKAPGLK